MICLIQAFENIFFSVKHVAGHHEAVQVYLVEITDCLNARELHFHREAAVIFPFFNSGFGFTVWRVSSPDTSFDKRKAQLFKYPRKPFAVFDFHIIGRRRVVIGHTLVAVRLRGDDIFSVGRFAVQCAA